MQVDELGNIFAIRAGQDNKLPPIALGSHLDTQPTGGRFDGILGAYNTTYSRGCTDQVSRIRNMLCTRGAESHP